MLTHNASTISLVNSLSTLCTINTIFHCTLCRLRVSPCLLPFPCLFCNAVFLASVAFSLSLYDLRFSFSLALCVILRACIALQVVFGVRIMLYQYRQLAIIQAIGNSMIIQLWIIYLYYYLDTPGCVVTPKRIAIHPNINNPNLDYLRMN